MRVLVVKLSSLGDLFHTLPAVTRIKEEWGADVDWVVNTSYAGLVSRFAPVRQVIGFPRKNPVAGAAAFLRTLRRESYDYVFDCQGLLKSALVARVARGERRIGPSFNREGSRCFYDAVAGPGNKQRHAVEENLDLLDHLGISRGVVRFPVDWEKPSGLPAGPRIGFLPCSRWTTKNWPPGHFVEVARQLASTASLFLFGAPDDQEICRSIAAGVGPGVINRCGQTSLVQLGGWLAAMDLVITVDSGPMHMAAASGTPVLAVFGATDPIRTGPYGSCHRVLVRDDLSCRPCFSRTCLLKEKDIRCLVGISPEKVVGAAREMLSRPAAQGLG